MINGNRSTVRISPFGPAPVRHFPLACFVHNDKGSLEDNLVNQMLIYRKHQRKPAEQSSKVDVIVYFSVDSKTLPKISTAIDAKDYFGYDSVENFVSEIIRPTVVGICKKIIEITGSDVLNAYTICLDQSL